MSLAGSGKARLALALPRYRTSLRLAGGREFMELFEQYALASLAIEAMQRETHCSGEMLSRFRELCLDIQADVVQLLDRRLMNY